MSRIDLNCDMGESSAAKRIGDDPAVMPFISSANIACGFHGGDPAVMKATVELALQHHVAIGAHPSFYDMEGFGRNEMSLSPDDVHSIVLYQISALKGFANARGRRLHHVKPHGALYNMAARMPAYASSIAQAIRDLDANIILYGLSGSELIHAGRLAGLTTCSEVFADRAYQEDGSLVPRSKDGAVIQDVEKAIEQMMMMVSKGQVKTITGKMIDIDAETICIHGDHEGAALFANRLNNELTAGGHIIKAMAQQHG